ncbi:MAG: hypothetical protein R3F38_19820 [Gammaproteobacteria bacterium]
MDRVEIAGQPEEGLAFAGAGLPASTVTNSGSLQGLSLSPPERFFSTTAAMASTVMARGTERVPTVTLE